MDEKLFKFFVTKKRLTLEKEIQYLRDKLHSSYHIKKSFTDSEVYSLSIELDSIISEYHKITRKF